MLENLPWERFIKLYDSPDTFFFVDPPYPGHHEYRHNLKYDDFIRLADCLVKIKGQFLMTHTDRPEIRALFRGLNFEAVEVGYPVLTCQKNTHKPDSTRLDIYPARLSFFEIEHHKL